MSKEIIGAEAFSKRFMMTEARRQQLQEDPTVVMVDDMGRRISLLLEQDNSLHLAFGRLETEGQSPRERAAMGNTEDDAVRGIGSDIYSLYRNTDVYKQRNGKNTTHT